MAAVTLERDVVAPVGRVWDVFTDLDRAPERLSGVTRVEDLSGQPFGEGTTWRETRELFGRSYTEQLTVSACRAPEHYVVEAQSSGAHYRTEFVFTPRAADTTRVRVTFTAEPTGIVARIVHRLIGAVLITSVTKALRRDLDQLAAIAERPGDS